MIKKACSVSVIYFACRPTHIDYHLPFLFFFFTSYFHLRLSFFPSGDIGGQVGLFLGASILTVLEFCDLLARIVVNKYKQRKRQRSRTV